MYDDVDDDNDVLFVILVNHGDSQMDEDKVNLVYNTPVYDGSG